MFFIANIGVMRICCTNVVLKYIQCIRSHRPMFIVLNWPVDIMYGCISLNMSVSGMFSNACTVGNFYFSIYLVYYGVANRFIFSASADSRKLIYGDIPRYFSGVKFLYNMFRLIKALHLQFQRYQDFAVSRPACTCTLKKAKKKKKLSCKLLLPGTV